LIIHWHWDGSRERVKLGMTSRAAIILAGGKGVRIGNTAKAFLHLNEKTLIELILETIQPLVDHIIVVIGRNDSVEKFREKIPRSIDVFRDRGKGEGTLVGLLNGLNRSKSEYSLVLPCDSPFISIEVLELLFTEALGVDAAIPQWPNGFIEPLHSVYKTDGARNAARRALKNGMKVSGMIERLKDVRYVPIEVIRKIDPELLTFTNINTLGDLRKASRIYSRLLARRRKVGSIWKAP